MPAPRHNKQHDARAASFRRIAKGYRAEAKKAPSTTMGAALVVAARVLDAEARQLRGMR
jgi:hypothetical protein